MDNTLLQSRIDFETMKKELYSYLLSAGYVSPDLSLSSYTAATLIALAQENGLSAQDEDRVWEIVTDIETKGMVGARLEPGVEDMLYMLAGKWQLTVLTNNSTAAALRALGDNRIANYFELIVGREQMETLKPSPAGIDYILRRFPTIARQRWLMIGDSWIDGKAAQAAGVPFVQYGGEAEEMTAHHVPVIAHIQNWTELEPLLMRR